MLMLMLMLIPRFAGNRDELSFEQTNSSLPGAAVHGGSVSLSLAEGCMHEVFVSSIVGGGERRPAPRGLNYLI